MEGASGGAVAGGERSDGRVADLRMALAAVTHEELDEIRQAAVGGAVDDRLALAPGRDQPGMGEFLEMEGQVVAGGADRLRGHAGREPVGTSGDEGTHNSKTVLLTERREGGEGLSFVHRLTYISMIVET